MLDCLGDTPKVGRISRIIPTVYLGQSGSSDWQDPSASADTHQILRHGFLATSSSRAAHTKCLIVQAVTVKPALTKGFQHWHRWTQVASSFLPRSS
jgi:hypothetical protein